MFTELHQETMIGPTVGDVDCLYQAYCGTSSLYYGALLKVFMRGVCELFRH
jgi:hypothetical protein